MDIVIKSNLIDASDTNAWTFYIFMYWTFTSNTLSSPVQFAIWNTYLVQTSDNYAWAYKNWYVLDIYQEHIIFTSPIFYLKHKSSSNFVQLDMDIL